MPNTLFVQATCSRNRKRYNKRYIPGSECGASNLFTERSLAHLHGRRKRYLSLRLRLLLPDVLVNRIEHIV